MRAFLYRHRFFLAPLGLVLALALLLLLATDGLSALVQRGYAPF